MNEYDNAYRSVMRELEYRIDVDTMLERIKNDEKMRPLKFLVGMDYQKMNEWITKALLDYQNIAIFKDEPNYPMITKCLLVKAYRKILQQKRKNGEKNPEVSVQDVVGFLKELED